MNKKLVDLLNKKNAKFDNFLEGVKKVNDIVPVVKQAQEETDWTIGILKDIPDEASNKLDNKLLENVFQEDLKIWTKALPDIKISQSYVTTSGSGASGTASEVVFDQIVNINGVSGSSQRPATYQWAHSHLDEYKNIQLKRNKVQEIEYILRNFNANLADEFDNANASYMKTETGVLSPKETANAMRNVLNHFQGNLLKIARTHPNENINKSRYWTIIADRLATGGVGSSEHSLLSLKVVSHNQIHVDLTDISKNTATNPLDRLKIVYVQWLDHLFTVLKLIDNSKFS